MSQSTEHFLDTAREALRSEESRRKKESRTRRASKLTRRFFGQAARLSRPERIAALVFVVSAIISLSMAQLGYWGIDLAGEQKVYLLLLFVPLLMGAMIFGPTTGFILGILSGVMAYLHATIAPVDFYEACFGLPLNTFVLLPLLGLVSGFAFQLVLKGASKRASRVLRIAVLSLVLSFAASALVVLNAFLLLGQSSATTVLYDLVFVSPAAMALQIFADAFVIALFCCLADAIVASISEGGSEHRLTKIFRGWVIVVSSIVFMLASMIVFTAATFQSQVSAREAMKSDAAYLVKQVQKNDRVDLDVLLDGYTVELDGVALFVGKDGTILASDDAEVFLPGEKFLDKLGYADVLGDSRELYKDMVEAGGFVSLDVIRGAGVLDTGVIFLLVNPYDDGYVVMAKSTDMVYERRFGIMLSSAILSIALILSMAVLASKLLNVLVLRRIGETNESLGKITHGDLGERIEVRGSREFASLSRGINTMVEALRKSFADMEAHNARDLMTAKAIQEGSLPTYFPAFEEIKKFDLYASMKTAKEVGGDFYDFFEVDDAQKVAFVIADVSGKGVPAALFMMRARAQVRTYLESGMPIGEAINMANHQLCLGNEAGMFVTLFACVLDYETGQIEYVNAGHNPPLIFDGETWEWMRDVSGMPLGLYEGIPYKTLSRQLAPSDMVYMYTDGVTEAMDADENLFGDDRLVETLIKYSSFNPRSVCVGVRRALTDFTHDAEQSDDITMLSFKYGVEPESSAVMVLPATVDQLVHVNNYVHAELQRRNAPKSAYNPLDIAAEELFVNVCHYAYPDATPENPGEVRVCFEYTPAPPSIVVQIIDDGIEYNPLAKPDAVTPSDIADVPIGGLGILMAKRSVDDMTYERKDGSNILTFRKNW